MPEGTDELAQMVEALRVVRARLNDVNHQLPTGKAEVVTSVLQDVGNVLTRGNGSVASTEVGDGDVFVVTGRHGVMVASYAD